MKKAVIFFLALVVVTGCGGEVDEISRKVNSVLFFKSEGTPINEYLGYNISAYDFLVKSAELECIEGECTGVAEHSKQIMTRHCWFCNNAGIKGNSLNLYSEGSIHVKVKDGCRIETQRDIFDGMNVTSKKMPLKAEGIVKDKVTITQCENCGFTCTEPEQEYYIVKRVEMTFD